MSKIKGYIFDYGGTLDTKGCHWGRMIQQAYERVGVPVKEDLFREAYVFAERELGKNPIIQPDYTFEKTLSTKIQIEMEFISKRLDNFQADKWHGQVVHRLYDSVLNETYNSKVVLEELKKHYPLVLVSNFYGNINTVLKEMKLDNIFKHVIESAVVGVRKPNPEIFMLGVKALKMAPEEVVVVGDSYDKDIIPAKQAGCQTVWLKGKGWTDEEPDGKAADRIITRLDDLLKA